MSLPTITSGYVAILALVYAALALQVVRLRRSNRTAFGDGGNDRLRCAIRAHGHFAEYVPIIALMSAMLEMSGAPSWRIHLWMGALLLARLLHPIGIYAGPRTWAFQIGRVGGMTVTIAVMVSFAVQILVRGPFR
jgi:uncharacterized membrane protein YecN with MAPEG domain